MNSKNFIKITFIVLFIGSGILALNIKLNHLAGSKAAFTLFDSFAPISGAFVGTVWGIISVTAMQLVNLLIHGSNFDIGFVVRLIPTAFAVIYFSKNTKLNLIVPLLAIISFNLNPVGQTVWFYSLFWLIPIVCYWFRGRSLIARSLGATFTAHAVGGAIWIWLFNLPAQVWIDLIPVVIIERIIFTIGIAASYALTKKLLDSIHYPIHETD